MKYIFLLFILIITILLAGFYSENMDTYVMRNALVNSSTGAGRLTTIDTDGNFSATTSDVMISAMINQNIPITTTPAVTTTVPYVIPSNTDTTESAWIQGLVR